MVKRVLALALIVTASTLFTGCGGFNRLKGPGDVFNADISSLSPVTNTAITGFYGTDEESAKRKARDTYIAKLTSAADILFAQYATGLTADKSAIDTLVESSQMTLGVAATMVGGAQAKENLAATIALITGGKAIFEKNYFGDKAADAFIATMDAARKKKLVDILKGMSENTSVYTFVMAQRDVTEYVRAGTPGQALSIITEEAKKTEVAATAAIAVVQGAIRDKQANLAQDWKDKKLRMTRSLPKATNEGLTKAVNALVGGDNSKKTDEELKEILQNKLINADNPAKVGDLYTAFEIGQLLTD